MSMDPNDLLMSGGVPSAKFDMIGTVVKGTVVHSEVTQQTDFQSGQKKTWPSGDPMYQVVVTLQTDQRDPSVEDDDGQRRVFVKGQMQAAVREALRKANAKLEVGGTFAVQYVSDEPASQRGMNPKKVYRAEYVAPSPTAAANDLLANAGMVEAGAQPVTASSLI